MEKIKLQAVKKEIGPSNAKRIFEFLQVVDETKEGPNIINLNGLKLRIIGHYNVYGGHDTDQGSANCSNCKKISDCNDTHIDDCLGNTNLKKCLSVLERMRSKVGKSGVFLAILDEHYRPKMLDI